MDKLRFTLTVPDKESYRCSCGSLEYDIEEISKLNGFKRRHKKNHSITCTMTCSQCGKVAEYDLRNSLFGK